MSGGVQILNDVATLTALATKKDAATSTERASGAATSVNNTYQQLLAASASAIKWIELSGYCRGPNANQTIDVFLSTGPGGAEVERGLTTLDLYLNITDGTTWFSIRVEMDLPAATRVAWKFNESAGAVNFKAAVTVGERA